MAAKLKWEYQKDDGVTFSAFKAGDVKKLEEEWSKGSKHFTFEISSTNKYAIDLEKMTQTNLKTKKERVIRRVTADGEVTCGRIAVWEWNSGASGGGDWKAYTLDESAAIEKAYLKDALKVTVKVTKDAHDTMDVTIHFGHMSQTTADHKDKHRSVRRRMKAVTVKGKGEGAVAGGDASSKVVASTTTATKKTVPSSKGKAAKEEKIPPTDDDEEEDASPRKAKLAAVMSKKKELGVDTRGKRVREDEEEPTTAPGGLRAKKLAALSVDDSKLQFAKPVPPAATPEDITPAVPKTEEGPTGKVKAHLSWWMAGGTVMMLSAHQDPRKALLVGGDDKKKKPSSPPIIKVAAFDMDDTLIKPPGKNVFPTSASDWEWMCTTKEDEDGGQGCKGIVPSRLKQLHEEGFHIVLVSNQAGVATEPAKAAHLKAKVPQLMKALNYSVPISAALATGKDEYRKPEPGLWDLIKEKLLYGCQVDLASSFYVGDAAGRYGPTLAGRKKDFSCSDRKFAYNASLKFFTPDEFFLSKPPAKDFHWDGISPKDLLSLPSSAPDASFFKKTTAGPELALMIGPPGCGKSTVFQRFFKPAKYVHANRDSCGSKEKCANIVQDALDSGKSVVVDNTNPGRDVRKLYIDIAKKKKVPVRCFWMQASVPLAKHMNAVRMRTGAKERIPGIAYNMYQTHFREPEKGEGINEVIKVPASADFDFKGGEEVKEVFYMLS